MDTKSSVLLLDMCTSTTALLIRMVCGTHLTYPSCQSLRQHSVGYRGTVTSWTVGHRAVTTLKVLHFFMICTIAFTGTCVLRNILSSCAFLPPHHRILEIKFTGGVCVFVYTHYSHLTLPEATQMYLLGKNPCVGGSVQLIN